MPHFATRRFSPGCAEFSTRLALVVMRQKRKLPCSRRRWRSKSCSPVAVTAARSPETFARYHLLQQRKTGPSPVLAGAAVAQSVASTARGGACGAGRGARAPRRPAREGLAPSLEKLRAEIARDGATPSLPKSSVGTRKRVVIAGGGFCGAMVAYRLDKNPDLHVTLLDTKEYVENTPLVLRLMCLAGKEFEDMFNKALIEHKTYVKNGDVVIGSLAAVRTDHILYGAKTGGRRRREARLPRDLDGDIIPVGHQD